MYYLWMLTSSSCSTELLGTPLLFMFEGANIRRGNCTMSRNSVDKTINQCNKKVNTVLFNQKRHLFVYSCQKRVGLTCKIIIVFTGRNKWQVKPLKKIFIYFKIAERLNSFLNVYSGEYFLYQIWLTRPNCMSTSSTIYLLA